MSSGVNPYYVIFDNQVSGIVVGQNLGLLCIEAKTEFGGNRKEALILSWQRGEHSRLVTQE